VLRDTGGKAMADAVRQRVVRLLTDAGRAPDVAVPAKQSSLVSALHGYPRFGTPRDLAPNANYIGGTISVAVPWLAVALTCLVLALGANLCCAPLRRRKRRARREEGLEEALKAEQKREDKNMNHGLQLAAGSEPVEHWPASAGKEERASRQDRDDAAAFIVGSPSTASISASSSVTVVEVSQLLWGVVLFNLAFLLVGIALIANFAFREGIIDVLDSIRYMKTRAAAPVALATFFVRIVERVATSSALSSLLSNISPALADTANLQRQLETFTSSIQTTLTKADNILRTANRVGLIVFVVLVLFILLLLMGLFLLFLVQSGRRKAGLARFLLLVPVTLSWLGAAVMTVAVVFAGDACVSVDGFQRLIIVQAGLGNSSLTAGINPDTNALFANGFKCPVSIIDPTVLNAIAPLLNLNATGSSSAVDSLVGLLFPGEQTKGVGQYASNIYEDIIHCESVARFAANLNSTACGRRGPILAMFALWIGVIILAVVLTFFFFIAQYSTFDTTRFYTPRIFVDPPKDLGYGGEDPLEEFPK
jgi:hypothetical protein